MCCVLCAVVCWLLLVFGSCCVVFVCCVPDCAFSGLMFVVPCILFICHWLLLLVVVCLLRVVRWCCALFVVVVASCMM